MKPQIIKGGEHLDHRGKLSFINDFNMSQVRRFYTVTNTNTLVVRAWRGHRIEQRWFHVTKGRFEVKLVKIDDWVNPSKNLKQELFMLSASSNEILHIPKGYASSLKAKEANSEIIIFADFGIEHAKDDDYLFPLDHFTN